MATDGSDLARRLGVVERARGGDHGAFVDLYRQDAPPAWRLALALTGDGERAADAVARAFARTLAPLPPSAVRSEVLYRQRLLTATRDVVLDQATASSRGRPPLAALPAPAEDGVDGTRSSRGVEVMHAFHQLPERWRSVLWLVVVEGLGTAEAARVLGVGAGDAEELLVRAHAGLRTQWIRDRRAAGAPPQPAPEHLEQHLQTLLPLPVDLFAIAEGRWRAGRVPAAVPLLLLPLPGGRTLPRWAERGLLASTAALIALGITSALAIDRDPDVQRARRGDTAARATTTTLAPQDDGGPGAGGPAPVDAAIGAIDGAVDDEGSTGDGHADPGDRTVAAASNGPASHGRSSAATTSTAPPSGSTTTTTRPPTTSTTAEPLLEVAAGIGPALALSLGDQCTGLLIAGQAIGCEPDPNEGVAVEGSLVPGGSSAPSAPTFLFTDVEGSTRLWEAAPASMRDDLADHDRLLAGIVRDHGGSVFKFRGDGVAAVFPEPDAGVAAAVAAQRSLTAERWRVGPLRVRMGLHSGEAQERDGDWFGPTVNRTARLHDVAHGGQIVVSGATATLVADRLPADITLLDLGEHRLRDLVEPEHIHQVLAPDLSTRFSPLRTEHHPSRGVPAPAGRLLGRAIERRRLDELVSANRTVTITGPPGGGKSRLAVELARDHRDHWPGGVWFCSLASLPTGATGADGVASRLADLLGSAVTDGGTPLDAVVSALSERRALVVLDGCDHVLADAATVAAALRDRCLQTAVLVTSRERLGIADEHLLDLPTLADDDAVALFVERAAAVRQDFDAAGHGDAVRSLIGNLDGLPLAIELAAARVRTHEPAEIDRLLQEQVRVLRSPRRRGGESGDGHEDLEAAIAWSYDLLDPAEQQVFRHVSVFAGACTPADLADRVPDLDVVDCTDLLDGLVERSLVALAPPRASDRSSRYRLLTTLRAYARRRLEEHPDGATAPARHAELVVAGATAAAARLCGPDEVRWVRALADQWEDIRAVVRRALETGDVATAVALVGSLTHHSTMRGVEVGEWADRALVLPGFWEQPDAAVVAGLAGEIHLRRADFDGARRVATLTMEQVGADEPATWLSHSTLAMAVLTGGDLQAGLAELARMQDTAGAYAEIDPLAPAVAAYMACTVQSYGGLTRAALRHASEVAAVALATGCPTIEAMSLLAEGRAVVGKDPARARPLLERALELAIGVDNGVMAAQTRWALAEVAAGDDPEGALRSLRSLLGELQALGDQAQGQQTLLRSIGPLLSVGADDAARLATAALDVPAWDTTVLHRVARQRVSERTDAEAWAAAKERAASLGLPGVLVEVAAAIDALLDR